MKGFNKLVCAVALFGTTATLTSCIGGKEPGNQDVAFSFTAVLSTGGTTVEIGDSTVTVNIITTGDSTGKNYQFTSKNTTYADVNLVDGVCYIVPNAPGRANIGIVETTTNEEFTLSFQVVNTAPIANGGFNYSSASGEEAIARRTEILGQLEKYAYDSHLTGIPLFENGGYVKYSKRVNIPATNYITGYGFGILSEGDLTKGDGLLPGDKTGVYKDYLHSAQTSDSNDINAWNANGSQISDLASYITSSYWSTRMNSTKTDYEWYPLLAADTYKAGGNDVSNDRPLPVGAKNDLGLYKTWKIYVKTDANMQGKGGLKYRTKVSAFDNTPVTLEDYEFAYRLLLTQAYGQFRGAEMADDKTYGIKGALSYYNRTKDVNDQTAKEIWDDMIAKDLLGIKTGTDEGGDYIQLEIINEIDNFTAMYTLSSSLVSPMSEAFIKSLSKTGTVRAGLDVYGKQGDSNIPDHTLSLGAYYLDVWDDSKVVFTRNDDWFECKDNKRYKIPGVYIQTCTAFTPLQLFQMFDSGMLDSTSIPQDLLATEIGNTSNGQTKVTEGDATFKLNVNSCTEEKWNELFAKGKKFYSDISNDGWSGVKPWMSNDAFLKGIYWSIDRETFAKNRGVNPSIDYFSNAYLNDPENGGSYNKTTAHKNAVSKYHDMVPGIDEVTGKEVMKDNYGYNLDKAIQYFKTAVGQLRSAGKLQMGEPGNPTQIEISISWMNPDDITNYGNEIARYITTAFNDPAVCNNRVKLSIVQKQPSNDYNVVYNYMKCGKFDLAFGAISGNTYNPLNFMEVLKSDNSSTFTLNWGPDTSIVDAANPIVYDGNKWSYDALWEVADHGGIVENGAIVKTVKDHYVSTGYNDLSSGGEVKAKLGFVDVPGVEINIDHVDVYVAGGSNNQIDKSNWSYNKSTGELTMNFTPEFGASIAEQISSVVNKNKTDDLETDLFVREKYDVYFTFEVYYSLRINNGSPSQSFVTLAKNEISQEQ